MPAIVPVLSRGSAMDAVIRSELRLCYTCGSCVVECPVNRFTNRLHPLRRVRMAGFGMTEELLRSPEIWYCLLCNKCSSICPMTVKPGRLFRFLREEAIRRGYAGQRTAKAVNVLQKQLHRERHRSLALLKEGKANRAPDAPGWPGATTPISPPAPTLTPVGLPSADAAGFREAFQGLLGRRTNISSCYTCGECTNSCPVAREGPLLHPMQVVRMVMLGLREEVLDATSIWLCLSCGTCTSACGQLVRCHMVIRRAQELAIAGGFADAAFLNMKQEMEERLFTEYVGRIDSYLSEGGCAIPGQMTGSGLRLGVPEYETVHQKQVWGQTDA